MCRLVVAVRSRGGAGHLGRVLVLAWRHGIAHCRREPSQYFQEGNFERGTDRVRDHPVRNPALLPFWYRRSIELEPFRVRAQPLRDLLIGLPFPECCKPRPEIWRAEFWWIWQVWGNSTVALDYL